MSLACHDCRLTVVSASSRVVRCPKCKEPLVTGPVIVAEDPIDTRGHDKATICRSNQCGRYDAATDTCRVLTDRGKRGAITWLYSNPDAKCVHPSEPQF